MIDPRFYTLRESGMTVGDLCARLGLEAPEGTLSESVVSRPAALAGSVPQDIVFLESRKAAAGLDTAKATACFVPEKFASEVADRNIIPILSDSPKYHLAQATALLVSDVEAGGMDIDPTARIHPTAVIGAGVKIGARTVIGSHTTLGHCIIGADCRVGSSTVIGGTGFGVVANAAGDILSVPHIGRVIISDRVQIGSNCCIDRGQLGDTVIGEDTKIDNLVQIAHNCTVGRGCVFAGCVGLSGSCTVGDYVQMGGRVGLADHITVGDKARLAAFAGVMHDIPAGETWSGIPAVPIREHMKMVAHTRRAVRK